MGRSHKVNVWHLVRSQAPKCDRYGDPVPDGLKPLEGIQIGAIGIDTRLKKWTISRRPRLELGDGEAGAPWTCVTNYTTRLEWAAVRVKAHQVMLSEATLRGIDDLQRVHRGGGG